MDQTPEEKLKSVEQQIFICEELGSDLIKCPYCGASNYRGSTLCCMTLARAMHAVIERQARAEIANHAEEVMEAVYKN